ncbi:MAG: copper chaperone PCu(A)C [Bauldia sp.]|nr:copper chaperone PCu(A)C [Bauldia sp.]MCW5718797.1 copper chaperone PCu(A)C [Bauldia sp.]
MRNSFALAFAGLLSTAALAQETDEHVFTAGALTIEHPWVRAAQAGADTLAFAEFINTGPADTLLSVAAPVAAAAEIVGLTLEGGVIGTVAVGPVEIPTGAFSFDPGGLGLMLHGVAEALAVGTEIELTLSFAIAGEVTIHVLVEPANAMAHSHAH